jgi:ribulose-5-phosphate 4-epimerase/fuculose-1-phosphate aldolase
VRYRNLCFQRKYIGLTEGVGYGNISVRYKQNNQFIISGTQTGGLNRLSARHFTLVTRVDFINNSVTCKGPVKASAESLTHAMFYLLDENIQSVIHIHHRTMWEQLKYRMPTTSEETPYGTIAMCNEVERLYRSSNLKEKKLLVMAGHQDGIISFGKNLEEALRVLDAFTSY